MRIEHGGRRVWRSHGRGSRVRSEPLRRQRTAWVAPPNSASSPTATNVAAPQFHHHQHQSPATPHAALPIVVHPGSATCPLPTHGSVPSRSSQNPQEAATSALQLCASSAHAVLAPEVLDISRAVDEFLQVVPPALLFHSASALPDEDRIATRRHHLLQCGASSVRAGTAFVKQWLQLCSTRNIPNYGMPVDSDLLNSFLSMVDHEARRRSLGKAKQTGASVQHAMACAARWVADHAGLPFAIAKQQCVRKANAPSRERDPAWAEAYGNKPLFCTSFVLRCVAPTHRYLGRMLHPPTWSAWHPCDLSMACVLLRLN